MQRWSESDGTSRIRGMEAAESCHAVAPRPDATSENARYDAHTRRSSYR